MADGAVPSQQVETVMETAAARIRDEVDDWDVEWGWEQEFYGDGTRPVITVTTAIESVDEWQDIKHRVREIVRAAEPDDVLVYTRVDRRRE